MRFGRVASVLGICVVCSAWPFDASGQEPPPRIPFIAADLHATVPKFPASDNLAASRGMTIAELPGRGWGLHGTVTIYPLKWHAVTFGLGGEITANRATYQPDATAADVRGSEEKFVYAAPQLSFNFGSGHGWSYLSGGIGYSRWSLVPDGSASIPPDTERLKTINYGGGARWFVRPHLAFSFDARFYAINPGTPYNDFTAGSPRTTLFIVGAGISVK